MEQRSYSMSYLLARHVNLFAFTLAIVIDSFKAPSTGATKSNCKRRGIDSSCHYPHSY